MNVNTPSPLLPKASVKGSTSGFSTGSVFHRILIDLCGTKDSNACHNSKDEEGDHLR